MSAAFKRVEDDGEVDAHLASGPALGLGSRDSRVRRVGPSRTWLAAAGVAVLVVGLGVWFIPVKKPEPLPRSVQP